MFTKDDIRNMCFSHVNISKLSEISVGYSEEENIVDHGDYGRMERS